LVENLTFPYCFCIFVSSKTSSRNCGTDSSRLWAVYPTIAGCTAHNWKTKFCL